MENYICNTEKYFYQKGYIALPIKIENLQKNVQYNNLKLTVKSKFHISLLCVKDIISQHDKKIDNLEHKIIEHFCQFVSENPIEFINYKNECRFAEVDKRKSIIVMCEVSNIEELFASFRERFGIEVDTQPTHTTLYTLQPDAGIGITTEKELRERTKIIPNPNLVIHQHV